MKEIRKAIISAFKGNVLSKEDAIGLLRRTDAIEKGSMNRDIAIIGLSVLMPNCPNKWALWEGIRENKCYVGMFPNNRVNDILGYTKYTFPSKDPLLYMKGAYLKHIDYFDNKYFKIPPVEAKLMDPNQRLFLQTAYKALEDAGLNSESLAGSNTGVYIGYATNEIDRYSSFIRYSDKYSLDISAVGNMSSVLASRISYLLDLHGPATCFDTACSSSLVALHQACVGIKAGDCDTAVVGGIKLHLLPSDNIRMGIESSDGLTKSFDNRSDGTGLGEGVIALIVRDLTLAEKNGDSIYAVIKGTAINQDGKSIGITAPSVKAQARVIEKAYKQAQINPADVSLIEAHGTGTPLGDPIEIEALSEVFSKYTEKKQYCAIGSLKANFGHLYEASGLASVAKAILCIRFKQIPALVHFSDPNKHINFMQSPFFVPQKTIRWEPGNRPRTCGISSFGYSGTNCHVVLQEYIEKRQQTVTSKRHYGINLSSGSKQTLRMLLEEYITYLRNELPESGDLCYTVNMFRKQHKCRLVIGFTSIEDLQNKIMFLLSKGFKSNVSQDIFYIEQDNQVKVSEKGIMLEDKDTVLRFASSIDWCNREDSFNKISVPGHQFEEKKFWVELPFQKTSEEREIVISPLIDRKLLEHRIAPTKIMIPTSLAFENICKQIPPNMALYDYLLQTPCILGDTEEKRYVYSLNTDKDELILYELVGTDKVEHIRVKYRKRQELGLLCKRDYHEVVEQVITSGAAKDIIFREFTGITTMNCGGLTAKCRCEHSEKDNIWCIFELITFLLGCFEGKAIYPVSFHALQYSIHDYCEFIVDIRKKNDRFNISVISESNQILLEIEELDIINFSALNLETAFSQQSTSKQKVYLCGSTNFEEVERKVGCIWAMVLEEDTIDVNTNFFELGADSIIGVHLLTQLERHFDINIKPETLFKYPTIRQMAQYVLDRINGQETNYMKSREN